MWTCSLIVDLFVVVVLTNRLAAQTVARQFGSPTAIATSRRICHAVSCGPPSCDPGDAYGITYRGEAGSGHLNRMSLLIFHDGN